jgi:hypothetical protein
MAGAGVVGVPMGNQGARDGACWVNVEIAWRAKEPGRRRQ